jgi:Tol biopolymer transport system component
VRIDELDPSEFSNVDGFLTEDGLTLYFNSDRPAHASEDLFVATRRTKSSAFDPPVPLSEINTSSGERDPWLSSDGKHLFFASNRGGEYSIYEATR